MDKINYLIIGGGVAGTTAAETIRSKDPNGTITIVTDEKHPLYSKPMLTHYLVDEVKREDLFLKKPEFYKGNKIELMSGRKVEKLDTKERSALLDDNQLLHFDKCLIAVGGKPRQWILDGKIVDGIYDFRTVEDAEKIKKRMESAKEALVIGGGFISIELAKVLVKSGINTTMLLRESYCSERAFDEEQAKIVHAALEKNGVRIVTNEEAVEIKGEDWVQSVLTNKSREIPCDMVCLGIGLVYDLKFLEGSGVKIDRGIATDGYLKTNVDGIYAAGDVAEYYDVVTDTTHLAPNWTTGLTQGRTAALNMAGFNEPYKAVPSQTLEIFEANVVFVGNFCPLGEEEVIIRKSPDGNSYGRILLRGDRVVGATLINQNEVRNALIKLIMNQVGIGGHKDKLKDINTDINSLA